MKNYILLFLVLFFYMVEIFFPLKKRSFDKSFFKHAWTNFFIIFLGTLSIKALLLGLTYISVDYFNLRGLLSLMDLNQSVKVVISIVLLDFLIWFQHLVFHHVPFFWRLHKVHHADTFLDTSSGLRFHPVEILLSFFYKMILIFSLGIDKETVLIFDTILSGFAIFNHSNIYLPKWLDNLLSLLIVTPNVHQVHHSDKREETNSNFGFNIVIWDKLFGTYKKYDDVKDGLRIGLEGVDSKKANSLTEMLKYPLSRD